MSEEDVQEDWVATRVEAAAAAIDEDVSSETRELLVDALRTTMVGRPLRAQELAEVAQNLIVSTSPQPHEEDSPCD